ncbi:MAG: DUF3168 domain-containing protein [Caulobacter sp.]|nr:DUF3168 domain-containing protein [Caulobacter sp.]
MENTLKQHLLGDPTLAALVADRINWVRRPEKAGLPAITLRRVGGPRDYHMQGASGLVLARLQIDCWGASFGAAKDVAKALIASLNAMPRGDIVQAVFINDETDVDDAGQLEDVPVFNTRVDARVWHTE